MGYLMYARFERLELAHAVLDDDAPLYMIVVTMGASTDSVITDRDGRDAFQRGHKCVEGFDCPHQFVNAQGRQRFPFGLAHIEYMDNLERRYKHLNFLLRLVAAFVHHLLFLFPLVRRWSQNLDALLSWPDVPVVLFQPVTVPSNKGRAGELHLNQDAVAKGIVMEAGEKIQVFPVFVAGKNRPDALLQSVGDALDFLTLVRPRYLNRDDGRCRFCVTRHCHYLLSV